MGGTTLTSKIMTPVAYWVEKVVGEVYKPSTDHDLRRQHFLYVTLAGIASCVTAAGVTFATLAALEVSDSVPIVILANYIPPAPVISAEPAALANHRAIGESMRISQTPSVSKVYQEATTPKIESPEKVSGNTPASTPVRPAATERVPTAREAPVPAPAAKKTPEQAVRTAPKSAPPPPAQTMPIPASPAPAVKLAAPAKINGRSDKPVDIAPADKLGIRNMASEALTLANGTRVPVGQRLPNGEVVQSIDVAKGRIETDQRVMMVTP